MEAEPFSRDTNYCVTIVIDILPRLQGSPNGCVTRKGQKPDYFSRTRRLPLSGGKHWLGG